MLSDYGLKLKSDYFISCTLNELAEKNGVDFPPRFFTYSHLFFSYAFEHGVLSDVEKGMCLLNSTCSDIADSLNTTRVHVQNYLSFLNSLGVVERIPNGSRNGRTTFVRLSAFTD